MRLRMVTLQQSNPPQIPEYKHMTNFKPTSLQLHRDSFSDNRSKVRNTGKEVYVYHWNRIIAALVVVLILLIVSVYVFRLVYTDEGTTPQLSARETGVEQLEIDETEIGQAKGSVQPASPAESGLGSADAEDSNPIYTKPETSENAVDADQATGSATQELSLQLPPPKTQLEAETATSKVSSLAAQVAEPAVKPASQVIPTAASNSVFHLEYLQILSPNVTRFELSSAVKDLEPVGSLQDITLGKKSPAKLFAYSDINNMKGEHLNYIWKHGDRIVNRVKIGVWSNRWRNYASKNIEQRLAGDWHVELRDSSDRLLAKAGFRFDPDAD